MYINPADNNDNTQTKCYTWVELLQGPVSQNAGSSSFIELFSNFKACVNYTKPNANNEFNFTKQQQDFGLFWM